MKSKFPPRVAPPRDRYYDVRHVTDKAHIRVQKAPSPVEAFRRAYGHPPVIISGHPSMAEYKDLGPNARAMRAQAKFTQMLHAPEGWVSFDPPRLPKEEKHEDVA